MIEDENKRGSFYESSFDFYSQPYIRGNKLYEVERLYIIVGCMALTLFGIIMVILGLWGFL